MAAETKEVQTSQAEPEEQKVAKHNYPRADVTSEVKKLSPMFFSISLRASIWIRTRRIT